MTEVLRQSCKDPQKSVGLNGENDSDVGPLSLLCLAINQVFPGPINLPEHLPRLPPSHPFLNGGL